jgi:hypothetical protein
MEDFELPRILDQWEELITHCLSRIS